MANNNTHTITIDHLTGECDKYKLNDLKANITDEIYLNISTDLLFKKLNSRLLETKNDVYATILPKILRSITINNFFDKDLYIFQ